MLSAHGFQIRNTTPLPFLQTRPESNFRVTSMCKFSPRTFYLRIPECDIFLYMSQK